MRAMRFTSILPLLLLMSCADSRAESVLEPQAAVTPSALTEIPIFEQWPGYTCGNDVEQLYTLEGTARIQQRGDLYVLVGSGTVSTTDGFVGSFNRTFVFKGDQVLHMRFHDMELDSSSGIRMIFSMGMYHTTSPDGEPVVEFEKYGGFTCVS